MSNSISRAALIAFFCISLPGCAIGVKSTSLEDTPAQQGDEQLLSSVGFVLDDENYAVRDKKFIEDERTSWIDALSKFTDKKNIFIMSGGKPTIIPKPHTDNPQPAGSGQDIAQLLSGRLPAGRANMSAAPDDKTGFDLFQEFAKTHPVVHVYIKEVPDPNDPTNYDMLDESPLVISFLTFWVTPASVTRPYTASFSLSMPEGKNVAPAHWDYLYDRKEYYWLPLFPVAENTLTMDGKIETDLSWQVEEKRRLVLKFLADAKSILHEH